MSCWRQFRVNHFVPAWPWVLLVLVLPVTGDEKAKVDPNLKITKCFECSNYDKDGNFYDQCPKNGTVVEQRAYLGNCTGKCFTHDYDQDRRLVYRGCTSNQYGLPDPLPADGCYPWYSEIWCVCSTDRCNQAKLGTPNTKDEFDAHLEKEGGNNNNNNNNSSSPLRPLGLLQCLHLVCASIAVTIITACLL